MAAPLAIYVIAQYPPEMMQGSCVETRGGEGEAEGDGKGEGAGKAESERWPKSVGFLDAMW